jgi:hypothetical protein
MPITSSFEFHFDFVSYIGSQKSATDPERSHKSPLVMLLLRIPQFLIHNSPEILNPITLAVRGSIPTQPKRRVSMGQSGHTICMILAGLAGVRPAVVAL